MIEFSAREGIRIVKRRLGWCPMTDRPGERTVIRRSRRVTPEELIHDIGGIGLWLGVALMLVMGIALALEAHATL